MGFKLTRRDALIGGASALAVTKADAKVRMRFATPPPTVPVNQMFNLPMGGGGYIIGNTICDDGTEYSRTDVYGGYKVRGTLTPSTQSWSQINTLASLNISPGASGPTGGGGFLGVWAVEGCATDSNYVYQVASALSPAAYPTYAVFYSRDGAATWTQSSLTFSTADALGTLNQRFGQNAIAVDPNNRLHCIVGSSARSSPNNGVWRCLDGETFTQIAGLPNSTLTPGCGGIVFDRYGGLITLPGGQIVTKRFLVGTGGGGYWETWDGGQNFTQISSAPTPSSPEITVVTTTAQSVICIQTNMAGQGSISSISNNGANPTTLSWYQRGVENWGLGVSFGNRSNSICYYALAPAGTYKFTVNYNPGALVSGNSIMSQNNVFEIKNADVSGGIANIFACAAAETSRLSTGARSITTTTTSLIFAFAGLASSTPDASFSIMSSNLTGNALFSFWSEISTSPLSANIYSVGAASAGGACLIIDAIKQGTGTISAGTPQYITAGPASRTLGTLPVGGPVNPTGASMDYDGNMWVIDGPESFAAGAIFRYMKGASVGTGTWSRLDGSGATGAPALNWPHQGTNATILCDPRDGQQGVVWFVGEGTAKNGWQSTDANTVPIANSTWHGGDGDSSVQQTSVAPVVLWQDQIENDPVSQLSWNPLIERVTAGTGLGTMYYSPAPGLAGPNWEVGPNYYVVCNYFSQGIEEALVQQVLSVPGSNSLFIAAEDREVYITTVTGVGGYELGGYPTAYVPIYDCHGWMMDYATDNHDFIVSVSTSDVHGFISPIFSYGGGAFASWHVFPTDYPSGNGNWGGQVCVTSASQTPNSVTFTATAGKASATSLSTVTVATGSRSLTIQSGKQDTFAPGFPVVANGVNNSNNLLYGTVTSYNNGSGVLVLNVTDVQVGTATENSWILNVATTYGEFQAGGKSILVMTGVTGTPAVGDTIIGSGIPAGTTLVLQGGGSITNSWTLSDLTASQPSPTAMSITYNNTKMVVIMGTGGQNKTPVYTLDCAKTWHNCVNLPTDDYNPATKQQFARNIVADRVTPDTMYVYSPNNGVYISSDGGVNWSLNSAWHGMTPNVYQILTSVEGYAGHLWLINGDGGVGLLYHSETGGTENPWTSISGVTNCTRFALTATKPGTSYPTIAIYGSIGGGAAGFYYSTDKGVSWTTFNGTLPPGKNLSVANTWFGDVNIPGRVYFNTNSSGTNYIQLF